MHTTRCRSSRESDIRAIHQIYSHYVRHSLATFETEPPDEEEIRRRRTEVTGKGLPHIVAEIGGTVVGYAYAAPYRSRTAYRYTVEDSIYIHPSYVRRGLGRLLLAEIIRACEHSGHRQMVAIIGDSANRASVGLHAGMGFEQVGVLRCVGLKFGRWVDTVIMQRQLGDGGNTPA
ncbi:MAG: N-acetyltransferase [Bryobacterales bacterium]|nr:N-acetyltransferase [Bryobacterales bacterium]